jgi:hypothetical protein
VTAGGWLIVLEVAVDTVVELGVLVGTGGVAEELLEDDGDEEEIGGIGEDEGVLWVEVDVVEVLVAVEVGVVEVLVVEDLVVVETGDVVATLVVECVGVVDSAIALVWSLQ